MIPRNLQLSAAGARLAGEPTPHPHTPRPHTPRPRGAQGAARPPPKLTVHVSECGFGAAKFFKRY